MAEVKEKSSFEQGFEFGSRDGRIKGWGEVLDVIIRNGWSNTDNISEKVYAILNDRKESA